MPKNKLTPQQKQFIENYIADKSKRQQKQLKKQYEEFVRRKGKVEAALARLPDNHPERPRLQQLLDNAQQRVDTNQEFTSAYQDLEQVKADARAAANGFLEDLTAADIVKQIRMLDGEATHLNNMMRDVRQKTLTVFSELNRIPQAARLPSAAEAIENAKNFGPIELDLRTRLANLEPQRKLILRYLEVEQPAVRVQRIAFLIERLSEKDKKAGPGLTTALGAVEKKLKEGGTWYNPVTLRNGFQQETQLFDRIGNQIKDVTVWQQRDPESVPPKFLALQQREQARLKIAKERMELDSWSDGVVTSLTDDPKAKVRVPPKTLESEDFTDFVATPLPRDIDDNKIQEYAKQAAEKLRKVMTTEDKDSDYFFRLSAMGESELTTELQKLLGVSANPYTRPKQHVALLKEMSKAMSGVINELTPNKMNEDRQTIELNGKKYTNPVVLGEGANGKAVRYEDPKTGESVVVKSLKDPSQHDAMFRELMNHREAQGEGGHPNMLGLKGMVRGPGEEVHIVLECAGGGDVKGLSHVLQQSVESGLLPQGARNALTQHLMKQAIRGLKYVQERNMLHHDIKDENFLLGEDGKIKIGDFGSAQVGDDRGQVGGNVYGVTPAFKAPEINSGVDRINGKSDVYTLGTMLAALTSDTHGYDVALHTERGKELDYRSPESLTALDRLKNAMLDPDPSKRPNLEGVELATYLSESDYTYTDEQMEDLMKAVLAYGKLVPSAAKKLRDEIAQKKGEMVAKIKQKVGKVPPESTRLEQEIANLKREIEDREKECKDKINDAISQYVIQYPEKKGEVEKTLETLEKMGELFK